SGCTVTCGATNGQTVSAQANGCGSYTLRLTITSLVTGTVTVCEKSISVTTPGNPIMTGCPSNATVTCTALVPPAATVTAVDACGIPLTVGFSESQSKPGSSCGNVITRTWTAADACGK